MNQIVLIGNGFDIAHNLKTRYRDYIFDLLKGIIKEGMIHVGKKIERGPISFIAKAYIEKTPNEFIDQFKTIQELLNDSWINHNISSDLYSIKNSQTSIRLFFEPGLVKNLVSKFYEANWVDIETEFYTHLKNISKLGIQSDIKREAENLTHQMGFLRDSLKEYLIKESSNFDFDSIKKNNSNFIQKVRSLLFPVPSFLSGASFEPTHYKRLIINYNYLDSVKPYLEGNDHGFPTEYLNIHGNLDDEIIFGYGDVESLEYRDLLKLDNIFLRKSLKNFRYPSSNSYLELSNLLDQGEFIVQVVGHSCGASDGTTMRKIFDHVNCRSIRLCFLNHDEFEDKVIEIARHCTNQFINDKIYPRDQNLKFPIL